MIKKFDFSKAEKGKFYTPIDEAQIPVYLDNDVKKYFLDRASEIGADMGKMINSILRKEIQIIQEVYR